MKYLSPHKQAIVPSIKNSITFLFSCIIKGKNEMHDNKVIALVVFDKDKETFQ